MFTVKATYHGEIRRLSFPDTTFFPTFEQLDTQIRRIFPSSRNYYLAKLLFSFDSTQPGRILIGREVHSADEYNACLRPFLHRSWPRALLRFSIYDEISMIALDGIVLDEQNGCVNQSAYEYAPDILSHPQAARENPLASIYVPPPPPLPVLFESAPRSFDGYVFDATSESSCVSIPSTVDDASIPGHIQETKDEIKALIQSFKHELDQILDRTSSGIRVDEGGFTTDHPPSVQCSTCGERIMPQYKCTAACIEYQTRLRNGDNFAQVRQSHHHGTSDASVPVNSLSTSASFFIPALPNENVEARFPPLEALSASPLTSTATSSPHVSGVHSSSRTPTQDAPVIHRGVICDNCETTIVGIRHKCLDCLDYDLCSSCISSGAQDRHHPHHKFLNLNEPTKIIVHTLHQDDQTPHRPPVTLGPPVVHFATCDLCDSVIEGNRYKCAICPDFDTCDSCFTITKEQHPNHSFVKISDKGDFILREPPVQPQHHARCDGCNKHIDGIRYKCMHPDCPDFDFCAKCEALPIPQHPNNHPMLKMRSSDTIVPTVYRVVGTSNPNFNFASNQNGFIDSSNEGLKTPSSNVVESASPPSLNRPISLFASTMEHETLIDYTLYPSSDSAATKSEMPGSPSGDTELAYLSPPSPTSPGLFEAQSTFPASRPISWHGDALNNPLQTQSSSGLSSSLYEASLNSSDYISTAAKSPIDPLLAHPEEQGKDQQGNTRTLAEILQGYSSVIPSPDLRNTHPIPDYDGGLCAALVADATPNGQIFAAGVTFIKFWRMVNNGNRDWPAATRVVFVGGEQLSTLGSHSVGLVKAGEQTNVWTCELTAPDAPGKYTSYWRLQDGQGQLFGDSIWVEIEVVNPSYFCPEDSLTSSSIIVMPNPTSGVQVQAGDAQSTDEKSLTGDISEDDLSDTSSVSLISVPASENEDDDALWDDCHFQM